MKTHFLIEKHIALLTKHGKEDLLRPIFHTAFGAQIERTSAFDTDELGTFDNKIKRTLSPVDAALKKAYLACELTKRTQGLGSEGSFSTFVTGATANTEVIAFVDIKTKIEVIGFAQQFIGLQAIEAKNEIALGEKMQPLIAQFGSSQKWILLQGKQWHKGLDFSDILPLVKQWPCVIEPDFRAHHCPARQQTIALAAQDVVKRLQSHCPRCRTVNFVQKHGDKDVRFLPCEYCGAKTTKQAPRALKCDACHFEKQSSEVFVSASAAFCTLCNP